MSVAPLFHEVADGPQDGRAEWLTCADGVRIRVAVWHAAATMGTVLLLPGRSEYVEKYGRAAAVLAEAGYCTVAVDWRGQGLADRALPDRLIGHVGDFAEYQRDMDAMLVFAAAAGLARPYHMIAHSMGGCIGLRSLMRGLPMATAVFSSPMWGIPMAGWLRPLATVLTKASHWLGFAGRYAPGTNGSVYVTDTPFVGNTLTTDAEMWDYMRQQALAHPDLSLGGPSFGWLKAALEECAALAAMQSPHYPVVCALGTLEQVVDPAPILARMSHWETGRLDEYDACEHEVMMERPATREAFLTRAVALFKRAD
ncbi:MAG: alpha/beta hydrolase [bacterium]